jgi:hypothetical protein
MSAQDDINAAVTAVTGLFTDLQAQVTQLATDVNELGALIQSGQPVDTSALNNITATVAGVQATVDNAVSSVTALTPPPAPAPGS